MDTTLLLVDDHPVFRKGLRLLLEEEPDMRVVGEAGDGHEAIDMVRELAPDVVVMDITMPNLDGIEATRRILSESPHTKVVAMSIHGGKNFVEGMLGAGASGYILKEAVPEELVNGVRLVVNGEVYLSRAVTEVVVSEYRQFLSQIGQAGEDAEPAGDEISTDSILRTKFRRPPLAADDVPRPRLVEMLEAGRHRSLTVISAPAGYGKSTLASQWLEECPCSGGWVSLDEKDNDLRLFVAYLSAAIVEVFPGLDLETRTLLQASQLPPVSELARCFLNDLDQMDEPVILVLDDYHLVTEPAVHQLLNALVQHPSPMLHLVLISRIDPPLPLATLRGTGQLTEIGTEPLCFTASETSEFLERVLGMSGDEETVTLLEQRMEGWVTGLRLVALSVGQDQDIGRVLVKLQGAPYFIVDYLMQEVLLQVPPSIAQYLLETSILERFCASLCEALQEPGSQPDEVEGMRGREFVEWMEKAHLFVVPLDETHGWFRYHQLFQQLLRDRLQRDHSPEEIGTLHRRASQWLEGRGLIEESIEHALAAKDVQRAARIVERYRHDQHEIGRWYTVENWLARLPEEIKQQRPALVIAEAWMAYLHLRLERIPALVELAEGLLDEQTAEPALLGELNFFRGTVLYWLGDAERSGQHLEVALAQVGDRHEHVKSNIELHLALARHSAGQGEFAIEMLNEQMRTVHSSQAFLLSYLIAGLAFIHFLDGKLKQVTVQAQRLHTVSSKAGNANAVAWSWYFRACAHLHSGDLAQAARSFSTTVQLRQALDTRAVIDAMSGLALAQQLAQQPDDAAATASRMPKFCADLNDLQYLSVAQSCQARLWLLRGQLVPAVEWARSFNEPLEPAALFVWLEVPQITQARVLIADGSQESLDQATELLQAIRQQSAASHFSCQLIEVAVLQCLALEGQGRSEEAQAALAESLALAAPGGWIRPFVEAGIPMGDMLTRLKQGDTTDASVDQILAAFRVDHRPGWQIEYSLPGTMPAMEDADHSPLIEPLTSRELEVMRLLAQRLTNKEIATEMYVAIGTVKAHTHRIFGKLGVDNRRQAVARAAALGLLDPE